jgi:hypothetical protein
MKSAAQTKANQTDAKSLKQLERAATMLRILQGGGSRSTGPGHGSARERGGARRVNSVLRNPGVWGL